MGKRSTGLAGMAVIGSAVAGLGLAATPAMANNGNGKGDNTLTMALPGLSFPGPAPSSCSFVSDNLTLQWLTGNENKSGQTVEGQAELIDNSSGGTIVDTGHATFWGNAKGATLTYTGTAVSFHVTFNQSSQIPQVANLKC